MNNSQPDRIWSPFQAIKINHEICNGCNRCVDICPMDVLAANGVKGGPPWVVYPEECWFCGSCVELCPMQAEGAIRVIVPLPMRVSVLRAQEAT